MSGMNTFTLFTLAVSAWITTVEAITCDSTSPECCWAWRIREQMKLDITGFSTTNATSCCSAAYGITCNGNTVTSFNVAGKGISGTITTDFKYLKNLESLYDSLYNSV